MHFAGVDVLSYAGTESVTPTSADVLEDLWDTENYKFTADQPMQITRIDFKVWEEKEN